MGPENNAKFEQTHSSMHIFNHQIKSSIGLHQKPDQSVIFTMSITFFLLSWILQKQ